MVSRLEESFTRASTQDDFNKMRADVRDELKKLTETFEKEVERRTAVQSAGKIGLWPRVSESPPPVREAVPTLRQRLEELEALTAGDEELEAKLTASLSDVDKLKAQLTAMLEARQSKGGKP